MFFEGRWYRAAELWDRARRISRGLRELGIAPGDRVVVMMSNSPDVGVLYSAAWRAGAVITPVIFLVSDAELRHILADSEAAAVVTTPEFLARVQAAAASAPGVRAVVCTEREEGAIALDDLAQATPGGIVPRADSDLAALMYTGGTTGRAKGVMMTHANLWWSGRSAYDAGRVEGIARSLVPLPLSHAYGLLVTVIGLHSEEPDQRSVIMRWFDASGWLDLAQEHRVQISSLVPSMIQLLLAEPLEDYDLSQLRFVTSGAAPLAREVLEEFERRVPSVMVREGYGLTESSALISSSQPGARRVGAAGKPVPGTEVRIVGDDGSDLPPGEVGEICVRSPMVMAGYWKAPDLTAETVVDGWLHTGDLGRLDADGFLHLVDRKKDLVIRGGFNVYPRDVEDVLLEHPAVAQAAVVGRPDPRLGEEVVAVVALRAGRSAEPGDLVEFARERLGAYKYPREVRIVDAVPLTAVGKVDRKEVRRQLNG